MSHEGVCRKAPATLGLLNIGNTGGGGEDDNGRHSKSGFFCAITTLLLNTLRRKMAKKSLNMLIKWIKMDKKFRKFIKS